MSEKKKKYKWKSEREEESRKAQRAEAKRTNGRNRREEGKRVEGDTRISTKAKGRKKRAGRERERRSLKVGRTSSLLLIARAVLLGSNELEEFGVREGSELGVGVEVLVLGRSDDFDGNLGTRGKKEEEGEFRFESKEEGRGRGKEREKSTHEMFMILSIRG